MKTSTSFILGVIAGAAVVYALQRKDLRKAATVALGKGMKLKDDATRLIESLKEGVSDMIAEAAASVEEEETADVVAAPAKKAPAKRRAPAKKAAVKA